MPLKVFISSKMAELRDVRQVLKQAFETRGIDAFIYEDDAGARPENVVETSLSEVENADIFIGLFWIKFGEVTAQEYEYAKELGRPRFIYIRDKNIQREASLEKFLSEEIYDLEKGVSWDYFDDAISFSAQAAKDVTEWFIRRYREMTAEIKQQRISKEEIEKLQIEVERYQSISKRELPEGTSTDYLGSQLQGWLAILGYKFENYEIRQDDYFEWIIQVPKRRGFDRILVRGIDGEAEVVDVNALNASVKRQKADEGWLIAARRISQAARSEVAKPKNINLLCYTLDELIDEHANFSGYIKWLEEEITSRKIDGMYIPLSCIKEEYDYELNKRTSFSRYGKANGWIDGYIDRWLDDPSKEHISILGEFGTGKTWFALHYAWTLLERYKEAKAKGTERPRLPIVIPLRDYAKAVTVESLFSEFFFRKHEIPLPGYSAFEQLNKMGKLLLIFDGFDEMAAKIDRQKMINNFWELAKIIVPGSKAILTCRTEHFPEARAGRDLLSAKLRASVSNLTGEPPQFEVLELDKFDNEQIRKVLSLRADTSTVDKIMSYPELLDLAKRPIMAEFIVEALPDIQAGKPVDLSRIYLYAVRRKMERDIKSERTFTSLADKLYFLCELSWEMISSDQMTLNYRLFPERIRQLFGQVVIEQKDLDHWHYDMMGQTMLIRNSDGDYTPAHRSLLEFFVAYKFSAQIGAMAGDFIDIAKEQSNILRNEVTENYTWSNYFTRTISETGEVIKIPALGKFVAEPFEELSNSFGANVLTGAIETLMTGMVENDGLFDVIEATKSKNPTTTHYAGGNAATLIKIRGGVLAKRDYSRANLSGANLNGCNLDEAVFSSAILQEIHLDEVSVKKTNFSKSILKGAFIRHATVFKTDFSNIEIDDGTILFFIGNWAELMKKGATVLDAAFRLHSTLGFGCTGGTINGEKAKINSILNYGDRVWIHADPNVFTITRDWINFVNSGLAKVRINKYFRSVYSVRKILLRELPSRRKYQAIPELTDSHLLRSAVNLVIPEIDEEFPKYWRIARRQVTLEREINSVVMCLERYKKVRDFLFEKNFWPNTPRSSVKFVNFISSRPALANYLGLSPLEFFNAILLGDVGQAEIAKFFDST